MNTQTVVQKLSEKPKLARFRRTIAQYFIRLPVELLAKTSVSPNAVSLFGLLLTLGAGALIVTERFPAAVIVILVAGFFDMLDGALARMTDRVTKFGGILDSTLDRVSEAVLLLSLLPFYARQQSLSGIYLVGLAFLGSYLVSYIRARAEGAGINCEVGIFTRPERIIVLALGLLLTQVSSLFLTAALIVIAVFGFVSAGQRLYHTWREARK